MHLATYSKAAAGKMISHYTRAIGHRDHIDRDGNVYNLGPEGNAHARFRALTTGLEIGPKTRPLADFVVTMPEGYAGDDRAIFKAVYDFLEKRVGAENVVCAYVHLDEPGARPHMHFAFVPITETPVMTNDKSQPLIWTEKDQEKNPAHIAGTQKVDSKGTKRYKRVPLLDGSGSPIMRRTAAASKIFSRDDMRKLHPQVEAEVCKALGVERVGLVLDENDAKRELSGLDHKEYERVTAEIKRAEADRDRIAAEVERVSTEVAQATERLECVQGECSEVAEKCASRKTQIAECREARRGAIERIGELERQVNAARGRVHDLERARDGIEARCGALEQLVERAEAAIGRLIALVRENVHGIADVLGIDLGRGTERYIAFARDYAPAFERGELGRDIERQDLESVMDAARERASASVRDYSIERNDEWQR